ncbi:GNAT family N-acetyltransferase [Amycolatopsis pigmentata]|uniref:GNAT family N-acetyltransferase n=1 Tax=Amycolatopsis pigmentata TaxID=450801 RepID=A0ABW5G2H7_9PSEU
MEEIEVRPARDGELAAVAGLRWQWFLENQRHQEKPRTPEVGRDEFEHHFVRWAREHASAHRCLVLLRRGEVIGMAWLAIVPRVPAAGALERLSGDLQCVYVLPHERNHGLGGRLIDAIEELARELGMERVTVHSSPRAVPAYVRQGFENSPRLLHVLLGS